MREPWFLAPERCAERGAVMRLQGHGEGCHCENCEYAFRPADPIPAALLFGEPVDDDGAEWDRARDRRIDEQNEVL